MTPSGLTHRGRTRHGSRTEAGPLTGSRLLAVIAVPVLVTAACGGAGADEESFGDTAQKVYDNYVKENMPGVDLALVQGAEKEGKVVFYSSTNTASNAVAKEFGRVFPFVTVEHVQIAGGSLEERFVSEESSGTHIADVLNTSGEPSVRDYASKGYCEKYTPTVDASYPDAAKMPGLVYRWGGSVQGIAYVQGKLDDDYLKKLSTWEGLADSANEDKVFGWIDAAAGGSSVFVNAYMYKEFGTSLWTDHLDNTEGTKVYGGTNPTTAALLQGEIDVTGPVGLSGPYDQWDGGAPLAWITPTPTLASPTGGCIGAQPPHPNAAKLLWEFILSDRGQQVMAPYGQISYKSDLGEVTLPDKLTSEPWYRPIDTDDVYELPADEVGRLKDAVITKWRQAFGV